LTISKMIHYNQVLIIKRLIVVDNYVVVLASGKGTRMKSKLYKVLHKVCGTTIVEHVVDAAQGVDPAEIVTIVGTGAGDVEKVLADKSKFAFQEKQLGTG